MKNAMNELSEVVQEQIIEAPPYISSKLLNKHQSYSYLSDPSSISDIMRSRSFWVVVPLSKLAATPFNLNKSKEFLETQS